MPAKTLRHRTFRTLHPPKPCSRSVDRTFKISSPLVTAVIAFSILLLFVIMSADAHAMVVTDVTIDDTLEGNAVRETITVQFENNTLPSLDFSLPLGATQVVLNGRRVDPLNGTVTIPLSCTKCMFSLVYVLNDVVQVEGVDTRSFSRTLNLPQSPLSLVYLLRLPSGAVLSSSGSDPAIVPSPTELRTDGERIIVRWAESRPELPQRYFVRFTDYVIASTEGSFFSEFGEWPVWLLLGVALGIGVGAGMGLQRHLHERFREDESLPYVPAQLLSPDERVILALLKKSGTVGQKEIGKELHWSKSKVSAIMTALEHKEIISRERIGRNYKVTLVKAIKE